MLVTVGRIGRPHGIRGEVTVEVRTDEPDRRFAPGARLLVESSSPPRHLVVEATRWHQGTLLVTFEAVADRTAAESLRDHMLKVDVDPADLPEGDDEFYDHQLIGLDVRDLAGEVLGQVMDVLHLPGQDLLVVSLPPRTPEAGDSAREAFVPFVSSIVPTVDLTGRSVIVDAPPGLFDLDEDQDGA